MRIFLNWTTVITGDLVLEKNDKNSVQHFISTSFFKKKQQQLNKYSFDAKIEYILAILKVWLAPFPANVILKKANVIYHFVHHFRHFFEIYIQFESVWIFCILIRQFQQMMFKICSFFLKLVFQGPSDCKF